MIIALITLAIVVTVWIVTIDAYLESRKASGKATMKRQLRRSVQGSEQH